MAFEIPYVTDAWRWLGQELQAETAGLQRAQRELDVAARQGDSFLATTGLKTLAGLHGASVWAVKTPSALAYGVVNFVATVLTDIPAAIRAIPETIQHSGNEIIAGGRLLADGTVSEGLTRVLDGLTGDVAIILGARGAVRTVIKSTPEAVRLTEAGYHTGADAVNAVIAAARSRTLTTPGTPLNLAMRHPQRGTVVIQTAQSAVETVALRVRSLIDQAPEAQSVNDPRIQILFRMVSDDPDLLLPYLSALTTAARESRPITLLLNELQQAKPEAFTSTHITAILAAAKQQFMMFEAIRGLIATRAAEFNASHISSLQALARQHGRFVDALLHQLQAQRPDLFSR